MNQNKFISWTSDFAGQVFVLTCQITRCDTRSDNQCKSL